MDPAYWTPSPADIAPIQSADLILLNGGGYAAWTRTATLPRTRVVDTSLAFTDRLIERSDVTTHSHGPEGPHAHAATAFTTWLDPELAVLQAAAIRDAFTARRPASADAFDAAFDELRAELEALDARQAAVAQAPQLAVIFSHPVYEYLQRARALRGASLHWEPDAEPTAEQWAELEELAADSGARWLIWEGPPLDSTVQGLRARGIESVVFAPSGNRPAAGDFLSPMTAGTEALEQVYGSR